jgi:hypothetical protein
LAGGGKASLHRLPDPSLRLAFSAILIWNMLNEIHPLHTGGMMGTSRGMRNSWEKKPIRRPVFRRFFNLFKEAGCARPSGNPSDPMDIPRLVDPGFCLVAWYRRGRCNVTGRRMVTGL